MEVGSSDDLDVVTGLPNLPAGPVFEVQNCHGGRYSST